MAARTRERGRLAAYDGRGEDSLTIMLLIIGIADQGAGRAPVFFHKLPKLASKRLMSALVAHMAQWSADDDQAIKRPEAQKTTWATT